MRIGMPEILAAGSVVLLVTGHPTIGWVFLGLSVLGAALRWGIELQVAQQEEAAKQKDIDEVSKLLSEAAKAFSTLLQSVPKGSDAKDTHLH